MTGPKLAQLRITLDDEAPRSRVQLEDTDLDLPCSHIEIRQTPGSGENMAVLYVPLRFVNLALVQRKLR